MKCHKSLTPALGLSLVMALLLGCKTDTGPLGAQPDEVLEYPNVTITDPILQHKLAFLPHRQDRIENDLLRISLPIRALSNKAIRIHYRVMWLDKDSVPIKPQMSWKHKRLEPRQPEYIVVNSTSEEAVDFKIQIRTAPR